MADDPRVIVAVANHLFSLDTLHEAGRLAQHAPEQLGDVHIAHLAHYVSPRELTAVIQRRADAMQRRAEEAFEAAQAHAAEQRRAAAAPTTVNLEGLTFEQICAQYPDTPATVGLLADVIAGMHDMNERNKERNAKIAALETRAVAAEQRAADLVKQLNDLRVELDAVVLVRS
jgi:phage gpG-like protein